MLTLGEYKANMLRAGTLRVKIESALSNRIPSALTPVPRIVRPVAPTGISAVDELLHGGLPAGAITEVVGPECSGRTALALSFISRVTGDGKVCAWIDVSDALDPESAAANGICLSRMLWVRCGHDTASHAKAEHRPFSISKGYFNPPAVKKGLHGGGFGPHPRTEAKGLSKAVSGLLDTAPFTPRCAEPHHKPRPQRKIFKPIEFNRRQTLRPAPVKPLARIEQALRVTDLLLQTGGFSAIVLDLGSIAPEHTTRVPAATWFRFRAAAERTQASILLLGQHKCAQSSADLVLRMASADPLNDERNIFPGISHCVEIVRQRFPVSATNVISMRKPPQADRQAAWQNRTVWAGSR